MSLRITKIEKLKKLNDESYHNGLSKSPLKSTYFENNPENNRRMYRLNQHETNNKTQQTTQNFSRFRICSPDRYPTDDRFKLPNTFYNKHESARNFTSPPPSLNRQRHNIKNAFNRSRKNYKLINSFEDLVIAACENNKKKLIFQTDGQVTSELPNLVLYKNKYVLDLNDKNLLNHSIFRNRLNKKTDQNKEILEDKKSLDILKIEIPIIKAESKSINDKTQVQNDDKLCFNCKSKIKSKQFNINSCQSGNCSISENYASINQNQQTYKSSLFLPQAPSLSPPPPPPLSPLFIEDPHINASDDNFMVSDFKYDRNEQPSYGRLTKEEIEQEEVIITQTNNKTIINCTFIPRVTSTEHEELHHEMKTSETLRQSLSPVPSNSLIAATPSLSPTPKIVHHKESVKEIKKIDDAKKSGRFKKVKFQLKKNNSKNEGCDFRLLSDRAFAKELESHPLIKVNGYLNQMKY